MSIEEELAFAQSMNLFPQGEDPELTFLVNLKGNGFRSWEGIVCLTPSRLVYSSAPGILSPGKTGYLNYFQIISFSRTNYNCTLGFSADGISHNLNISILTEEEKWSLFLLMVFFRWKKVFPEKLPWPWELDHAIPPEESSMGLSFCMELDGITPPHPFLILVKALLLLCKGQPKSSFELLKSSNILSFEHVRLRLLAEACFLQGEIQNAEILIKSIPQSKVFERTERLLFLTLGAKVEKEFSDEKKNQGYCSRERERNWVSLYNVGHLFHAAKFTSLDSALREPMFCLIKGWSFLQNGDISRATEALDNYKHYPQTDPMETAVLEAAISHSSGDFSGAFHLLWAAKGQKLLGPILELCLALQLEDKVFPFLDSIPLPDIPPKFLFKTLLVRIGAKQWNSGLQLINQLYDFSQPLSPFESNYLKYLKAECLNQIGSKTEAKDLLEEVLKNLSISRINCKIEDGFSFFLDPRNRELMAKAQILGAEFDNLNSFPDSALARVSSAQRFLTRNGSERDQVRAKQVIEVSHKILEEKNQFHSQAFLSSPKFEEGNLWRNLSFIARKVEESHFPPSVKNQIENLEKEARAPLTVAVMGEFNAGKSTLLNAWVGEILLPMGVKPTTAVPCLLCFGDKPSARIIYSDGAEETVLVENLKRYVDDNLANKEFFSPDNTSQIVSHVEISIPIQTLSTIRFVDTPGLNSSNPIHQVSSEKFIERADAIVWVFDATQIGRASEFNFLQRFVPDKQKILAVLNRIDEVDEIEINDLCEQVMNHIGTRIKGLIPLSAKEALQGKLLGDSDRVLRSGFKTFSERVKQELFSQALSVKAQSIRIKLLACLELVKELKELHSKEVSIALSDLQSSVDTISNLKSEWEVFSRHSIFPDWKRFSKERLFNVFEECSKIPIHSGMYHSYLCEKIGLEVISCGEKLVNEMFDWAKPHLNKAFSAWNSICKSVKSDNATHFFGFLEGLCSSKFGKNANSTQAFQLNPNSQREFLRRSSFPSDIPAIIDQFADDLAFKCNVWVADLETKLMHGIFLMEEVFLSHSASLQFMTYDPLLRLKPFIEANS